MPTSMRDDDRPPDVGATLPAKDLRFLVVEDHEFQRSMIVEMLEDLGVQSMHEAADGFSALEVTRELNHAFDIIVTDIDMPGMDGMAFIRRLGEAKVRASLIITSWPGQVTPRDDGDDESVRTACTCSEPWRSRRPWNASAS